MESISKASSHPRITDLNICTNFEVVESTVCLFKIGEVACKDNETECDGVRECV